MTIIYQYKVANASLFGFFKLLFLWKGSVYKLIFKDMIIFSGMYALVSVIYRCALNQAQRRTFEKIVQYCENYTSLIPISFILGFYVSLVVHRWWQQFTNVPWPDRTLFIMGSYLNGADERSRIMRRTVARYMLFGLILITRSISVAVMKRFPTLEHIIDAGFINAEEAMLYERVSCKYNKFWVPIIWANNVLVLARRENKIDSEIGLRLILEQLADHRDKCSLCFVYDWITIPLVYSQVVTLSVYTFFGAVLLGRQYITPLDEHPGHTLDLYVPIFTLLQFFFYMGWLKVAEQLINPFGEDDDDFDINWLIDRHTAVAMCLADQCHGSYPPLVHDINFNNLKSDLPYTEASLASRKPVYLGSTFNLARPSRQDQTIIPPEMLAETNGIVRRQYSTGRPQSLAGSLWSLFQGRQSKIPAMDDETSSILGNGTAQMNYYQANHMPLASDLPSRRKSIDTAEMSPEPEDDLPPEYVPLRRARASTDVNERPLLKPVVSDKERKWSFPLSLLKRRYGNNSRGDSLRSAHSSNSSMASTTDTSPLVPPPPSAPVGKPRFVVEPILDDPEVDVSKHMRNKQIIDKHMLAVSRPPLLSAIEEGNTIRSLKDIVPSPDAIDAQANVFLDGSAQIRIENETNNGNDVTSAVLEPLLEAADVPIPDEEITEQTGEPDLDFIDSNFSDSS